MTKGRTATCLKSFSGSDKSWDLGMPQGWVWWCVPVTSEHGRLGQEIGEFEFSRAQVHSESLSQETKSAKDFDITSKCETNQ